MSAANEGTERLIEGLLELALYVDDLARASLFYEEVLRLERLFADDRLLALDAGRQGILLLFQKGTTVETVTLPGGTIPPHDGSGPVHLAFAVSVQALPRLQHRLEEFGVPIEGRTRWPKGGDSLYVRDPDGHLVEFATPGLWPTY